NRFHNNLIRDNFNRFTAFLTKPVDRGAIDQGFLAIGRGVVEAGKRLRLTQTGYIRTYVFTMLLGVVLVVIVLLLPYIRQLLGQ
ncbi:MAG: hypothetical protein IT323_07940, partial [Anaerolineae bacterium]|nr:hypothetical protein [Anaerolineae bacterium]